DHDWGADKISEPTEVKQTFMMFAESDYPVLFGASPIQSMSLEPDQIVITDTGQSQITPAESVPIDAFWSPRQGELRWGESEPYPAVYELVSSVPVYDEEGWRTVDPAEYANEQLAP